MSTTTQDSPPTKAKVQRKARRSSKAILDALKLERDNEIKRHQDKLSKLEAKIEKFETKYKARIEIQELATKDFEELQKTLQEAKRQQRIIAQAMKAKITK